MKTWSGHDPVTAMTLLAILDGAAAGTSAMSDFERHFATACEIWSATASGELARRLPSDPTYALRDASEAFRYMGAFNASDALRLAAYSLSKESTPADRLAHLAVLADRLVSGVEKLDELLAMQASGLLHRRPVASGPRVDLVRGPLFPAAN